MRNVGGRRRRTRQKRGQAALKHSVAGGRSLDPQQQIAAVHDAFVSAGSDLRVTIDGLARERGLGEGVVRARARREGWRLEREVRRLRALAGAPVPNLAARLEVAERRWEEHLRVLFGVGQWPAYLKDQIIDATFEREELERAGLFIRVGLLAPADPANDVDDGPAAVVDATAFRRFWAMRGEIDARVTRPCRLGSSLERRSPARGPRARAPADP